MWAEPLNSSISRGRLRDYHKPASELVVTRLRANYDTERKPRCDFQPVFVAVLQDGLQFEAGIGMNKIGVIHTTKATIDSLAELINSKIRDAEVYNILDDSILKDMADERNTELVRWRWMEYAKILEKMGVDIILSACSTVGEFAEEADRELVVPVLRIDEAMAEKAVLQGEKISVFATLNSTLKPTVNLIKRKASEAGKAVCVKGVLVEGAYDALMSQKKELHDRKIAEAVEACMGEGDVIVLAQASMASAVASAEGMDQKRVLTSPELGIEKLKESLCKAY